MAIESNFVGAKGRRIAVYTWLPEGTPRDQVVIAHGYAEHSGRYDAVAKFLTARGFAVHAIDHHGHGKSGGARAVIERFAQADADIDTLVDKLRSESGHATVKLIGHSMGGSLALNYALNHQEKVSGLVLSGPAIGGTLPTLQRWFLGLLSTIAPRAGTVVLDGNAVSRDLSVVADYMADPMVSRGKVPARTAHEMYRAIGSYPSRVGALTVPCLLMHGDADTLVSPIDAAPLFQRIASPDKTIRIWPGLFHEIFNEPEREEVLALTAEWLEAHPAN